MSDRFEIEEEQSQAPRARKQGCGPRGCLGCLAIIIGVPLLLFMLGFYVLFHTSIPLKALEGVHVENGKVIRISGVTGTISSGVSIEKIVVDDEPEDTTVEGFTFRYNGFWDVVFNNRFIIEKLSTDRAVFVVGDDFWESLKLDELEAEWEQIDANANNTGDPGLFELRELNFAETSIKSRDGEIDIEIPLIRIAGLRIQGDDFDVAELEVTSDVLMVELLEAEAVEINEQELPFKKMIKGRVLPELHPRVVSEIDFSLELGMADGTPVSRLIAFKEQIEFVSLPDGTTTVEFAQFSPSDFVTSPGQVVPERMSLQATLSEDVLTTEAGEFSLGMTRFELAAQQIDTNDADAALTAKADVDGRSFEAIARPSENRLWPPFAIELKPDEAMSRNEQLAWIYFQRPYDELAVDERARVDEMVDGGEEQAVE